MVCIVAARIAQWPVYTRRSKRLMQYYDLDLTAWICCFLFSSFIDQLCIGRQQLYSCRRLSECTVLCFSLDKYA